MLPWHPLKLELSMEAVPGVRVLPQKSVMEGRTMLSAETSAKQWTVASPPVAVMEKFTGTIW